MRVACAAHYPAGVPSTLDAVPHEGPTPRSGIPPLASFCWCSQLGSTVVVVGGEDRPLSTRCRAMLLVKDPLSDATVNHFAGPEIVDIGVTCLGDRAVMTVTGELDVSNTAWLYECLHDAIDAGISEIVLDIEHLTYMDSTGLSVLVVANRRMQSAGGTLTVLSPTPTVQRLFDAAHVVPSLSVVAAA